MNVDVIERCDTFHTKGFPEDFFGDSNDQTIPSTYFDLTDDKNDVVIFVLQLRPSFQIA